MVRAVGSRGAGRVLLRGVVGWMCLATAWAPAAERPPAFAVPSTTPGAVTGERAASDTVAVEWSRYRSVTRHPLTAEAVDWTVVCFLGNECPLARLYAERLAALAAEFGPRGVRFVGVNSNPQDSPAEIQQYADQHGIPFPILKDADQSLLDLFQATRTPEVFVVDASSRVVYGGRIDDQYEPGIVRPDPTRHDLRAALTALLSASPVPTARTVAVGCLITRLNREPAPAGTATVTFARDVAPILNQRCVECHRAGEIGPFALTDYDEVVGWSQMILEVIEQGRMPPWHADPAHGKFVGERRMPAEERTVLREWVRQNMPRGELDELPAPPAWSRGWHLPEPPDVELTMREKPFAVPPSGTIDYQYFVVDPGWTEDRWVHAAQVIPGDAAVVHHAIVFVRPPDGAESSGIGWMGAYVPGQRTMPLPAGYARRIPAGSKLVFQMHYTPNGRASSDRTRVGVWFANPDDVTHEVFTRVALNHDFEIPPGADDHPVRMRLEGFARQSQLLGVMPHMHLRGKSFRLEAQGTGERQVLVSVPRYDFNWQHWYQFESSLPLAPIEALEMEVRFDNSASNPVNPAPDEYVTWGDQTWNEMAVAFLDVAHPRGAPHIPVEPARTDAQRKAAEAERQRALERRVTEFLTKMDRDGDGAVVRDETPASFQRFGFRQMDNDGNGRLDRTEIEAAAARSL
ncbi:MAG: redoxin domain-containing protein [Pirellulaceae bacterium]